MANVDCSGWLEFESVGMRAGGTGIYADIRESRFDRWTACSERGPFGVCMLTARPLKQGMVSCNFRNFRFKIRTEGVVSEEGMLKDVREK